MRSILLIILFSFLGSLVHAQSLTSTPFQDLLDIRFSTAVMNANCDVCTPRDCAELQGCDATMVAAQELALENILTSELELIGTAELIECGINNGPVDQLEQTIDMSNLPLPLDIIRIRICGGAEYYILAQFLGDLPSGSPYDVVDEIQITDYEQTFDVLIQGEERTLGVEDLLDLLFVDAADDHDNIVTSDYVDCGELKCRSANTSCTVAQLALQNDALRILQLSAQDLVPKYPLNLNYIELCNGVKVYVLEQEMSLVNHLDPVILESVEVNGAQDPVNTCKINSQEVLSNIEVVSIDPTCDMPQGGSIFISVPSTEPAYLDQYSIDGGITYQSNPLFNNLGDGGYIIRVSNSDGSITAAYDDVVSLQNPCLENDRESCSDGIDNDNDGLMDCDDPDCGIAPDCNPDIYCEVMDALQLEISYPNAIIVKFDKENIPTQNYDIPTDELSKLIKDVASLKFQLLGNNTISQDQENDLYLRMDKWEKNPENFDQALFYKKPLGSEIRLNREILINKDQTLTYLESTCNPKVINLTPDCDFSVDLQYCNIEDNKTRLIVTPDGSASDFWIEVYYQGYRRTFSATRNGLPATLILPTREVTLYVWDFSQAIGVKNPTFEDVECSYSTTIDFTDLEAFVSTITVDLGTCLQLEEIINRFRCSNNDLSTACFEWSNSTSTLNYSEVDQEICPSEDGSIDLLITEDGVVLDEITIQVSVTEPDTDGDGTPNGSDPDIDNDGVPNGLEGVLGDNDTDNDGIPNDLDDDIDGDGITNDADDDPEGTDTEDCDMAGDNDGDGIVDCEELECAPLLPTVLSTNITNASCISPTSGAIEIVTETNNVEFSIDGGLSYQSENVFGQLSKGLYQIIIRNTLTGCTTQIQAEVQLKYLDTENNTITEELLSRDFLTIRATLAEEPETDPPAILSKDPNTKNVTVIDLLGVPLKFSETEDFDFADAMTESVLTSTTAFLTYGCDDFNQYLTDYDDGLNVTWAHFERDNETSLEGTLYFGSKTTAHTNAYEEHTVDHFYDIYKRLNDKRFIILQEEMEIATLDQYYTSELFIDVAGGIKEILESFACPEGGNLNPAEGGIIPMCFYEDYFISSLEYYTVKDRPFVSGIIDAAYAEAEGIKNFLLLAKALMDIPICKIRESSDGYPALSYLQNRVNYLIGKINDATKQEILSFLITKYPGAVELYIKLKPESCEEQKERIRQFRATLQSLLDFINEQGFVPVLQSIIKAIADAIGKFTNEPNVHWQVRYDQGKILAQIAIIFVPGAGEAAVAKYLGEVRDFLVKLAGELGELSGKLGKYLDDVFLKMLQEAELDPIKRELLKLDIPKGGEDFLSYIRQEGLAEWEVLEDVLGANSGFRSKFDNLKSVEGFFAKYPSRIDEFKSVLNNVELHPSLLDKEAFLASVKIFNEIPSITNSSQLINVLSNVRSVYRVSDLESKGLNKFFRGTNLDVNGVPYPGNPNTIANGASTSSDPIVATIFGIEARTEFGGSGKLLLFKPSNLGSMKLKPPNRRVELEREIVMDVTPTNLYGMRDFEIDVDDARSIIQQITGHPLDSSIPAQFARQALEDAPRMSPSQIDQFYQMVSEL